MKTVDKLIVQILISIAISGVITAFSWYVNTDQLRATNSILFYIGAMITAPSFFIVAILKGFNYAMHFTGYYTFQIINFIFYSLIITLIQMFYFRSRDKG